MRQKIIDKKKYSQICMNCRYGRMPKDMESVLCEKNGIVDPQSKCHHYEYDPLRRKPERARINNDYSEEDFKL